MKFEGQASLASGPLRLWVELSYFRLGRLQGYRATQHRLMPDDLAPQVSRQGSRKVTGGRSEAEESPQAI